jgi:DNA-binding response OmpR family regulator
MDSSHPSPASTAPHVLVVDDDPMIREAVSDYLSSQGFTVTTVADGSAMRAVIAGHAVDLVVLDINLRVEDGIALARRLREQSAIPIVMLTGRSAESDKVMALELGADDYLTKPFSPRELLARIRAVLRRHTPLAQPGRPEGIRAYRFDGWELELDTRRLTAPSGVIVPLSNGEFSLLVVFLGAQGRTLSRDELLDLSRLHGDDVYNRSVNTQIMRLRRKLNGAFPGRSYVLTKRGTGYAFGVAVKIVY